MSEFTIQRIITDLYAEEVNCGISTSWDAGMLAWFEGEAHAPKEYASFSVGEGPQDYFTWDEMWTAVLRWFARRIVERHASLEDGAPMEVGCLECTMNTTPVDLTTGPCLYHLARDVLAAAPQSDDIQNTNPVQEPDNAVEDARGALGDVGQQQASAEAPAERAPEAGECPAQDECDQ